MVRAVLFSINKKLKEFKNFELRSLPCFFLVILSENEKKGKNEMHNLSQSKKHALLIGKFIRISD